MNKRKLIQENTLHLDIQSLDFSQPFDIHKGDSEDVIEVTATDIDDLVQEIEIHSNDTYASQCLNNNNGSIAVHIIDEGYVIEQL